MPPKKECRGLTRTNECDTITVKHAQMSVIILEREEKLNLELKAARDKAGKTQAQVAQLAEISERAYQNYEQGKRKPGAGTAILIANVLGIVDYQTFKQIFGVGAPKQPEGSSTDEN